RPVLCTVNIVSSLFVAAVASAPEPRSSRPHHHLTKQGHKQEKSPRTSPPVPPRADTSLRPSKEPPMTSPSHHADSRDLYQNIYETQDWYGNAEINRCPGVRLFP